VTLHELRARLQELESHYHRRRGQYEELRSSRERAAARREEIARTMALLEKVRLLLQEVSVFAREQARQQVEYMVTQALQYVFGADIRFKMEVQERRDRPEAEFYVASDYGGHQVVNRPQDARGGGVVDVISLALRVALLQTVRPPLPGPLMLDEPGKHVSEEYARNMALFLKSVADMFGRQVILVTHNQHLAEVGDRAFLVEMRNGESVVR